jgi:hypothetical protein
MANQIKRYLIINGNKIPVGKKVDYFSPSSYFNYDALPE